MITKAALSPVCILAGGLGTRLGDAVAQTPKPLLTVAGRPFLFHQLDLLRSYGAQEVVICVGYLGTAIQEAVGDGSAFGLRVRYSEDGPDLIGTAGAVRKAMPMLGERFLVLYGDTYLRIDYQDVDRRARESELPALMTVLRNNGQWDKSNADYVDGLVRYDKHHPTPQMHYIDYGLSVLTPAAFPYAAPDEPDLAVVLQGVSEANLLGGYEATERFYEIGTPDSLREADAFLSRPDGPPTPMAAEKYS